MENRVQPRPADSADEKAIEENLQEMNYPPKEDLMRQGEEVDADLESTDKQATAVEQVAPEK